MKRITISLFVSLALHAMVLRLIPREPSTPPPTFAVTLAPDFSSRATPLRKYRDSANVRTVSKTSPPSPPDAPTSNAAGPANELSRRSDERAAYLQAAYLKEIWELLGTRLMQMTQSGKIASGELRVRVTVLASGEIRKVEFLSGEHLPQLRALTLRAIQSPDGFPRFPLQLAALRELNFVLPVQISRPSKRF